MGSSASFGARKADDDGAVFLDDSPESDSVLPNVGCKSGDVRAYVLDMIDQLAKMAHHAGDFSLASELSLMVFKSTFEVSAALTSARAAAK